MRGDAHNPKLREWHYICIMNNARIQNKGIGIATVTLYG